MSTDTAIKKKPLLEEAIFQRLKKIIDGHNKFIITTHILPDGDGLGGEIALSEYLKQLGKECTIINSDPVPEKFSLVDTDFEIQQWDAQKPLPQAEVILAIDVNDWQRIGPMTKALELLKARVVYIDHHMADEVFKQEHIIDEEISSMGELLYRYFDFVDAEVNFKMAMAMYVSIFTDTNAFRHRKTTSLSHQICASLVEVGVNPNEVFQRVHQTRTLKQMHFLGDILKQVKTMAGGKIAWVEVTEKMIKQYDASKEDTQSFIDHLLILKDAEVALMFREEDSKHIKVSFRSKGRVEIFPLVASLGGGGHAFEAGTLKEGSLQDVVKSVLKQVTELVETSKK